MIRTKPKLALLLLSGLFLFTTAVISCNNGDSEKKDAGADTATKKEPATPPENTQDTTKMDTADTRPVKTTD
ncbi:MAG: hypothetical protein JNN00_17640 [Chitinophagaceae bacterium]|nr:hypothetical protein [Chitinophagaceae bacterium]